MALTRAFLHGSVSGYVNHRCRCDKCREAWRTYMLGRARENGRRPRRLLRYDKSVRDEYYPDKTDTVVQFRPTVLGERLLAAAAAREGRAPDDIIERLLRDGAANVRFDASTGAVAC